MFLGKPLTKWELFLEGFRIFYNSVYFRFVDYNSNLCRLEFFNELSFGWKEMYDNDNIIILSIEDYNSLVKKLQEPPDPKAVESIKKLMSRVAPWDN